MSEFIINNHDTFAPNPERFKSHLLDIIARGGDIDKIIQAGCRVLGNPVHVLSASEQLIARAGSAPESESIWRMIEAVGFPPLPDYPKAGEGFNDYSKVYNQLHHDHIDIRMSGAPRILEAVGTRSRVMGINITCLGRHAGNIYVLEANRPFCQTDSRLLSILASAVSHLLMNDQVFRTMKGESHEYLLAHLLTRREISAEDIHDRVGAIMPGLGHFKAILTVGCSMARDLRSLRTFRADIGQLMSGSLSTLLNDQVVVLLHGSASQLLTTEKSATLEKLLQSSRMFGGLSHTFSDSAQIRPAWQQSLKAIHYGRAIHPEQALHVYLEHLPHQLLDNPALHQEAMTACDPAILRIMEHDLLHKTEYTRTLDQFISCVGNMTEAAKALRIHYNTMKFRMAKIAAFFGTDEISPRRRLLLFMSFRLLELRNDPMFRQCIPLVQKGIPR